MRGDLRLAVDVGGTFTDVVLLTAEGTAYPAKVLSSPPNFSIAIKEGILAILKSSGMSAREIGEYTHGATVATNAIITRSGAKVALVTNKGFRDILEIRRMRLPRLYDIGFAKPPPLVPRQLRMEVAGRLSATGQELVALDERGLAQVAQSLVHLGVESVAVCFLHSYVNKSHEVRAGQVIQEFNPKLHVSISAEVQPESKEYERTSTTVINAYVQPVVSAYFGSMESDLISLGIDVPIMVMQSNGGMMPSQSAREYPIHIIESGPAAGVTGAYHLAKRMGVQDAITLDMGGTTAKASVIEGGAILRSPEYEVGGDISVGHGLAKGTGYLLRVPSIDIAEVGAGGGSIAWVDEGGVLKVGPRSAGAVPGPACYNLGGKQPTITDANVHLGFTNREFLAGGSLKIHPDLADRAIDEYIVSKLSMKRTEAAWGTRLVVNSSLIRALRTVSTERGRDPRQFVLFAFGGMGPVHAAQVAEELGISRVIVPPLPGLFSSLGLLFAEVEHHLVRSRYAVVGTDDFASLSTDVDDMKMTATRLLQREGYDDRHRETNFLLEIKYRGQDHSLPIPLMKERFDAAMGRDVATAFHLEHAKTYGYRSDNEDIQCVAIRCIARGLSDYERAPSNLTIANGRLSRKGRTRQCYFGQGSGWIHLDVVDRSELSDLHARGPIIIEEDDSAIVVPAGWVVKQDEWSNLVLDFQDS